MRSTTWMSHVFALVAIAQTAQGQVSLAPRRMSRDFQGEVPLLWEVEGQGILREAQLQLVDEQGKVVWTWQDLAFHAIGKGRWQVWTLETPHARFKALPEGRATLQCHLIWDQSGQQRIEETEIALRLENRGEGWLDQAFASGSSPVVWRTGPQWTRAGSLRIEAGSLRGLKRVRYQLIGGQDETVLRSWTELPLKGQPSWTLKGEAGWPEGPAKLWILQEGSEGQAWVEAREVWLGKGPSRGGRADQGPRTAAKRPLARPLTGPLVPVTPDAPAVANAEWLRTVEDPGNVPAWDASNRVATVAFGYWDHERNEGSLFPSDLQTQWRPLSFSLTGANGLGKPLYGVSYLLAAGTSAETVVEEATQAGFVLPQGAQTLQVGGVPAPVVFSPGTVDDFLGKPLAAGYGWAATKDAGGLPGSGVDATTGGPAILNAWDWSQQAASGSALASAAMPKVGVDAIQAAARFRTNLQAQIQRDLGTTDAEAALDGNRDSYALSFASPDPLGRAVLAKGLGSRAPETLDPNLPVLKAPMAAIQTTLSDNFEKELDNWYQLGPGASHGFLLTTPTNGYIRLRPEIQLTFASWFPFMLPNGHYPPGKFTANLGLLLPGGSPVSVDLKYRGTVKLRVLDDDGRELWSLQPAATTTLTAMPTLTLGGTSGSWVPMVPTSLWLEVVNQTGTQQVVQGTLPQESSFVYLDDLQVTSPRTYQGLQSPESALDDPAYPSLPGYSRTQQGTVDKPGSRVDGYPVTMVTDPDGSAVAEVKDFEGRTVLKIVNPTSLYTDAFKEYRMVGGVRKAFRPANPRTRGLTTGVTLDPAKNPQVNLVTQYLFDAEGHLRVVIPPLGLAAGSWGMDLTDAQIDGVLSGATTDFTGVQGRAQSLAHFATFNAYDYAGHLVATYNPDEGLTRFKVDQKGRVHYSQTEKQRQSGTWTRTLYDGVYRVLAVGELASGVAPASDLETIPTFDPSTSSGLTSYQAAILTTGTTPAMKAGSVSQNVYDDYQGVDPTSDTGLSATLRSLLPKFALWGPFASGHLTVTKDTSSTTAAAADATTIERYFYDQDGRIVIRWVKVAPSGAGSSRTFAIGIFYDFAGRVKRIVYPSGPGDVPLQVVYAYDDLGRLYAVGTPQDGAYFARYAYHPTGELRAAVYGPGKGFVAKQMLQDPQGWLRSLNMKSR